MPAARQRPSQSLSTSLASHVRRQNPGNVLPLSYYYRSGHILLRQVSVVLQLGGMRITPAQSPDSGVLILQADEYRNAGNEEQLFVILMRLCRQAGTPSSPICILNIFHEHHTDLDFEGAV